MSPNKPTATLEGYTLQPLLQSSVEAAYALEIESFPADEAASLDSITSRQKHAGQFFHGLYLNTNLVGFVNGTLTASQELHHETMTKHDPSGRTLCIHSVVVRPNLRRRGLATAMLRAYVADVFAHTEVDLVLLLSKAPLIGLYQGCGFQFVRVSPVCHGKETWFELQTDRISWTRKREVLQVDAFTSEPLGGNPAAVVFGEPEDSTEWMQSWGAEINLSETAFLVPRPDNNEQQAGLAQPARYSLRWFTPLTEVDLCGHATLASAYALWESRRVDKQRDIAFETRSGLLTTTRQEGGWITLDFPAVPPSPIERATEFQVILRAFQCAEEDIVYLGRNIYDVFVVLKPEAFRAPDIGILNEIECRGVIATREARADEPYDFVSRSFFPRCGIPEDPVTGSAHCCLAPYWSQVTGKAEMLAFQASKRGGVVRVNVATEGRVKLSGQAALVKAGYLCC